MFSGWHDHRDGFVSVNLKHSNLIYIIKNKKNCKKYQAVSSNDIMDSYSVIVILGPLGVEGGKRQILMNHLEEASSS